MADRSIDIVLNAINNTGPAVDGAIANLNRFGSAAEGIGGSIGSVAGDFSVGKLVSGLFSIPGAVAIASAAVVAGGAAIATNFAGSRDMVINLGKSIAAAAADAARYIGDSSRRIYTGISDVVGKIAGGIATTLDQIIKGTFDWAGAFNSILAGIVKSVGAVEFAFVHWKDIGTIAIQGLKLELSKFADTAETIFTKTIPSLMSKAFQDPKGAKAFGSVLSNQGSKDFGLDILFPGFGGTAASLAGAKIDDATLLKSILFPGFGNLLGPGKTDAATGAAASDFAKNLPFTSKDSELTKQIRASLEGLEGKLGKDFDKQMKDYEKMVPGITASISKGWKSLTGLFGKFGGVDWQKLFGETPAKSATLALPGLTNERFTTGVQQGGQESLMREMLLEQKKATGYTQRVAEWIAAKFPQDVKDGVRMGVEAAKSNGLVIGGNK